MKKFDYSCFEQLYIYPLHIHEYGLQKHLNDIQKIIETNPPTFKEINTKMYCYFLMPGCMHPQLTSLTRLKQLLLDNDHKHLKCRICRLLDNTNISYEYFSTIYSVNNKIPLEIMPLRDEEVYFTCPKCCQDTSYSGLRWLYNNLKVNPNFSFCKRKCNSIGVKYPQLVHLWDTDKNKISIYDVPATDDNMSHEKSFFCCSVCKESINLPRTPYNVLKNGSKCFLHGVKPGTSFAEMSVFHSFHRCLGTLDFINIEHKYKYEGNKEFDIYITLTSEKEKHKFAIELDGKYHLTKVSEDDAKNEYALQNNTSLVRVRDITLKGISFSNHCHIIQRNETNKEELTKIIRNLLDVFNNWIDNLKISLKSKLQLREFIKKEKQQVDVLNDENEIFKKLYLKDKKLLRDQLDLQEVYNQLRSDVRNTKGHYITTTEQDIKRPFVCSKCYHEWYQYVNVVVKNYKNTKTGLGCPLCANKDRKTLKIMMKYAHQYKMQGLTLAQIAQKFGRTQETISTWLTIINKSQPKNS